MKILYLTGRKHPKNSYGGYGGLRYQPKWFQNFVDSLSDRYSFVDAYVLSKELDQIGGSWQATYILFEDDQDATMFLLRWAA
jgi:hypothetical protein